MIFGFGFDFDSEPSQAVPVLSDGSWWADGSVSLPPKAGNYTSTTKLTDGSSGDQGTFESSSGDSITTGFSHAAGLALTAWEQEFKFVGSLTQAFFYSSDGTNWVATTDTNASPWFPNISYTFGTPRTATFSGIPSSAKHFRCVSTQGVSGSGFILASDSRLS